MTRFPTRARLAAILIAAAIGWSHGESQAITYIYSGTCAEFCDGIGLTVGDPVSGSVSFVDAALVPGSPYPAPLSFSLDFGTVHITDATADEVGLFAYPLPPFPLPPTPSIVPVDLTTFPSDVRAGEDPVAPATSGDVVIAAPGGWVADSGGTCSTDCASVVTRGFATTGSGAWSSAPTRVPEPATVSLLATGLLGTSWLASRLRRRSQG